MFNPVQYLKSKKILFSFEEQ